jgi:hypothetical protein
MSSPSSPLKTKDEASMRGESVINQFTLNIHLPSIQTNKSGKFRKYAKNSMEFPQQTNTSQQTIVAFPKNAKLYQNFFHDKYNKQSTVDKVQLKFLNQKKISLIKNASMRSNESSEKSFGQTRIHGTDGKFQSLTRVESP